jgi:hypothetical protein
MFYLKHDGNEAGRAQYPEMPISPAAKLVLEKHTALPKDLY